MKTVSDLCPSWKTPRTMTTKDFKCLLLQTDGWTFRDGKKAFIKGKHIGAGVYKVYLDTKE